MGTLILENMTDSMVTMLTCILLKKPTAYFAFKSQSQQLMHRQFIPEPEKKMQGQFIYVYLTN